jgi:hypothetical protein
MHSSLSEHDLLRVESLQSQFAYNSVKLAYQWRGDDFFFTT